jgi:hypothetical protein
MRIRKGLPPGYMKIDEDLRSLIERLHQLNGQDVQEVVAFIDYLLSGAEKLSGHEQKNGGHLKLYDFMEGGIGSGQTAVQEEEE